MTRPQWQKDGSEPDYRFSLANERTFLAWIRTALAILAGVVLLDQFAERVEPKSLLAGVALVLSILGAVLAYCAYSRWKGNEIAMRNSAPLPAPSGIPLLGTATICVALVLALGILLKVR